MVKIIRGLLFHETGLTVPPNFVIKWNIVNQSLQLPFRLVNALRNCPINTFGDGVFRYQVYVHPGTTASFWLCSFYDGVLFHGGVFLAGGTATNTPHYDTSTHKKD
ncbi:MAG: hypothetical protein COT43_05295 [Candidatus Marinimicrobia bacterium CG08_land_8_20_14_0_20_45_22]|nr:MAG: hypothetical protein COT43_05295 [Candidatus Marinimicrobia bacterium CG08_land_8_20_14_0_20_45_22]